MRDDVISKEQFRKWGSCGGKRRMARMSKEERSILAQKAAAGRARAAKRRSDEAGRERRKWLRAHGVKVSRKAESAMRFLEDRGRRFLMHFGYENAIAEAEALGFKYGKGMVRKRRYSA